MILIITSKVDGHVQYVTQYFQNQDWVRLNTEDLPNNVELSLEPNVETVQFLLKIVINHFL